MNIRDELEEIIELIENDEYIKAHDLLEFYWRKYKDDENTRQESFILKAFTNASIIFELYKMQRIEHSENVWNTYKKYEYLIDELKSINKTQYKQLKDLIYKKREQIIK